MRKEPPDVKGGQVMFRGHLIHQKNKNRKQGDQEEQIDDCGKSQDPPLLKDHP